VITVLAWALAVPVALLALAFWLGVFLGAALLADRIIRHWRAGVSARRGVADFERILAEDSTAERGER
jgi:hypothetical protein